MHRFNMSEINFCPACGGNRHEPLEKIDLTEQHRLYSPANEEIVRRLTAEAQKSASAYQMFRCADCGLEFARPMRSPPASWYELAYQTLDLRTRPRWEFDACVSTCSVTDTVFEFGCGDGTFLELCAGKGIKATGVDFSPTAVESCRQKHLEALTFDIHAPLP